MPSKFVIRGSNQETSEKGEYTVLETIVNLILAGNQVKEFYFDNEAKFRCYTIFIPANNGSSTAALSELNFGFQPVISSLKSTLIFQQPSNQVIIETNLIPFSKLHFPICSFTQEKTKHQSVVQ